MFEKPSPFENVQSPNFSRILTPVLCVCMKVGMWLMFFSVYTESIGLMEETYLSELPIIGPAFLYIDQDANAAHLISAILATFSVATPLVIWTEIFRQNILDNPREWISHPQNQIIASMAALVLALVISVEIVSLYSLIAKQATPGGVFIQNEAHDLMAFLSENKGMGIAVSIVIAVINIILGLFTARAFKRLKSQEGGITS